MRPAAALELTLRGSRRLSTDGSFSDGTIATAVGLDARATLTFRGALTARALADHPGTALELRLTTGFEQCAWPQQNRSLTRRRRRDRHAGRCGHAPAVQCDFGRHRLRRRGEEVGRSRCGRRAHYRPRDRSCDDGARLSLHAGPRSAHCRAPDLSCLSTDSADAAAHAVWIDVSASTSDAQLSDNTI